AREGFAMKKAGKDRLRQSGAHHSLLRAVANDHRPEGYATPLETVEDADQETGILLLHQPADIADENFVVGNAKRLPPGVASAPRIEKFSFHAARPDPHRARDPV